MGSTAHFCLRHLLILSLALPFAAFAQQPVPSKDGMSRDQLKTASDKKHAVKQEQATTTATPKAGAKLQLKIQQAELSLVDADQDRTVRTIQLEYPGKPLTEKLQLSERDKLVLLFRLQNQAAGGATPALVNQVFLRFSHANYPTHEIFAVAEPESSGLYKIDVSVGIMRSDFKSVNGLYTLAVDIGDAKAEKGISWTLGQAEITFNGGVTTMPTSSDFGLRPEIFHTFRQPEKRPLAVVTTTFLALVLVPLGLLLVLWARIGVNLSNFPVTLPSIVFFGSLGGIFYLYFMFWTYLNMFQTLNWLALLGTVAFISGGMLLRSIATRRVKQE